MKRIAFFLMAAVLVACQPEAAKTTQETQRGLIADKAMVVSAHPIASEVGKAIMEKGGNAVDAAIGVQLALAVVYPGAGNIGGGGFMITRMADGTTAALDYREKAPLSGGRNMYIGENGEVIPQASLRGHLAAGVPGSVAGFVRAHEKFGSLSWAALVQPAIDLAANGWALTEKEANKLNGNREAFIKYNTVAPDFFLTAEDGKWSAGDTVSIPELARTLERIRDNGRDGFYKGETADLIVEEMKRGGGIISHEDLEHFIRTYGKAKMNTPFSTIWDLLEYVESYN